jgi:hypothetical protein
MRAVPIIINVAMLVFHVFMIVTGCHVITVSSISVMDGGLHSYIFFLGDQISNLDWLAIFANFSLSCDLG